MYRADDLFAEAQEALDKLWFLQGLQEVERTDRTISLRLYIRQDVFIQAFLGEITGSLYFALIEGSRRIFGIDREGGEWHIHPFESPYEHRPFPEGLDPRPLLKFLTWVERLLLEHDLQNRNL